MPPFKLYFFVAYEHPGYVYTKATNSLALPTSFTTAWDHKKQVLDKLDAVTKNDVLKKLQLLRLINKDFALVVEGKADSENSKDVKALIGAVKRDVQRMKERNNGKYNAEEAHAVRILCTMFAGASVPFERISQLTGLNRSMLARHNLS